MFVKFNSIMFILNIQVKSKMVWTFHLTSSSGYLIYLYISPGVTTKICSKLARVQACKFLPRLIAWARGVGLAGLISLVQVSPYMYVERGRDHVH